MYDTHVYNGFKLFFASFFSRERGAQSSVVRTSTTVPMELNTE